MKTQGIVALLALASGAALAQPALDWPITIEHAADNASTCNAGSGGDPMIRASDGTLSLRFAAFPQAIWTVKPGPDGSFDAVVPSYADPNGARITVPAGTGPRPISTRQQSHPCSYRLVPK